MKRKKHAPPPGKSPVAFKPIGRMDWFIAGGIVLAGLGFLLMRNGPSSAPEARPAAAVENPKAAVVADAVSPTRLVGRWLRPDGGYVVELRQAGENGQLEASYSNPRPIHVSQSKWSRVAGALQVFIELRDVNYPGSTYTLAYDPAGDRLSGIYYQAALQQQFDVEFQRLP